MRQHYRHREGRFRPFGRRSADRWLPRPRDAKRRGEPHNSRDKGILLLARDAEARGPAPRSSKARARGSSATGLRGRGATSARRALWRPDRDGGSRTSERRGRCRETFAKRSRSVSCSSVERWRPRGHSVRGRPVARPSLLASRFSLLASRFSLLAPRSSLLAPRSSRASFAYLTTRVSRRADPDARKGRAAQAHVQAAAPRRRQQCQRLEAIRRSLLSWTRSASRAERAGSVASRRGCCTKLRPVGLRPCRDGAELHRV
jgi:hypothetical protein